MVNPVSARLLSQQLIVPQWEDPADVVSWFGAMQGQDYKAMRWAVAMRTKKPSLKAFEANCDVTVFKEDVLLPEEAIIKEIARFKSM